MSGEMVDFVVRLSFVKILLKNWFQNRSTVQYKTSFRDPFYAKVE
jgi:hypothetical protein